MQISGRTNSISCVLPVCGLRLAVVELEAEKSVRSTQKFLWKNGWSQNLPKVQTSKDLNIQLLKLLVLQRFKRKEVHGFFFMQIMGNGVFFETVNRKSHGNRSRFQAKEPDMDFSDPGKEDWIVSSSSW